MKIGKFDIKDISRITHLPPTDWNFDIAQFVRDHYGQDYFYSFIIKENGLIIGFGNIFLFNKVSWLGNIIVEEKFRGNGFGTKITKFLMDFSIGQGAETLRLIATNEGFPIYKNLGFYIEENYAFYRIKDKRTAEYDIRLIECSQRLFSQILELDFYVNGENREELLGKLFSKIKVYVNSESVVKGFCIPEFGNGYIVSLENELGIEMAKYISQINEILVVPTSNIPINRYIKYSDYNIFNEAPRMVYGKKLDWKPQHIFSRGTGYCA